MGDVSTETQLFEDLTNVRQLLRSRGASPMPFWSLDKDGGEVSPYSDAAVRFSLLGAVCRITEGDPDRFAHVVWSIRAATGWERPLTLLSKLGAEAAGGLVAETLRALAVYERARLLGKREHSVRSVPPEDSLLVLRMARFMRQHGYEAVTRKTAQA